MMLDVKDVTCRLGDRIILSNVSFNLDAGTVMGLIGSNGVGKTTLARACAGLLPTSTGSIRLAGEEIASYPEALRGRRLAYLPQTSVIHWPVTVRAVVELGRMPHADDLENTMERDTQAVQKAISAMALDDLADRPVTKLSGGERRRVLIARTLAQEPDILIADEPSTGLDPRHRLDLFTRLRQRASETGLTVLVVLHDLSTAARFCDSLMLLSDGTSLAHGSPEDVLTAENIATAYGVSADIDFSGPVPSISLRDTLGVSP